MSAVVVTMRSPGAEARWPLDPVVLEGGMAGLLSAVTAELRDSERDEVVALDLPPGTGRAPLFGIDGIRRALGVYGRPLTLLDLGRLGPEDPRSVAARVQRGAELGVDIFHDPVAGPETGVLERLREVRRALEHVAGAEGRSLLYAVRVSGTGERLRARAHQLLGAGANALVYDALSQGLGGLELLVDDPNVTVPILAATRGIEGLCGSSGQGLSWRVVLGTLIGRAGADLVLYPGAVTGGTMTPSEGVEVRQALRRLGVLPAPVTGPIGELSVQAWVGGADVVLPAAWPAQPQRLRVG